MNSIDFFILTFTLIFFIRGLFRGFVCELTTIVGMILGYIIAITYHQSISAVVLYYFTSLSESISNVLCFSALFIGTNIILRLISSLVTQTLKFAMLGWLNRLLGGFFGLLKSILIMGIIVFGLNLLPLPSSFFETAGTNDSIFYPIIKSIGPELHNQIQNNK